MKVTTNQTDYFSHKHKHLTINITITQACIPCIKLISQILKKHFPFSDLKSKTQWNSRFYLPTDTKTLHTMQGYEDFWICKN